MLRCGRVAWVVALVSSGAAAFGSTVPGAYGLTTANAIYRNYTSLVNPWIDEHPTTGNGTSTGASAFSTLSRPALGLASTGVVGQLPGEVLKPMVSTAS